MQSNTDPVADLLYTCVRACACVCVCVCVSQFPLSYSSFIIKH